MSNKFRTEVLKKGRELPVDARRRALAEFEKQGRTRAGTTDVDECVQLAERYETRQIESGLLVAEDRQGNSQRRAKTTALGDALRPYVDHIRIEIFADSLPPMPTRAAAATWINEHAAPPADDLSGRAHLERAQAELDAYNRIDATAYCSVKYERLTLPSLRGSDSAEWVFVAKGTPLARIRNAILVMELAAPGAFSQEALLEHLLTGKPLPRADTVRVRQRWIFPRGTRRSGEEQGDALSIPYPQIPRHRRIVIELDEDEVTERRFRRIYQAIRRAFRNAGMKGITAFDWRLQRAVEKLGGLPSTAYKCRGFWAKVRRHLGETELSEKAIRERYRRLRKRMAV